MLICYKRDKVYTVKILPFANISLFFLLNKITDDANFTLIAKVISLKAFNNPKLRRKQHNQSF